MKCNTRVLWNQVFLGLTLPLNLTLTQSLTVAHISWAWFQRKEDLTALLSTDIFAMHYGLSVIWHVTLWKYASKPKTMVLFYFYSGWVAKGQKEILFSRLLILLGKGKCLSNGCPWRQSKPRKSIAKFKSKYSKKQY